MTLGINIMTMLNEGKRIIYHRYVPETEERIEVIEDPKYRAVLIELKVREETHPIFATIKEDRMYCPVISKVYMQGICYLSFYKHLLPYGKVPDFDVLFSFQDDLFAIPIQKLMTAEGKMRINMEKTNEKILIPASFIYPYSLFQTRNL